MDNIEIRMRCIEAAARNPYPHPAGVARGVLESAEAWYEWIISGPRGPAAKGKPKSGANVLY